MTKYMVIPSDGNYTEAFRIYTANNMEDAIQQYIVDEEPYDAMDLFVVPFSSAQFFFLEEPATPTWRIVKDKKPGEKK